MKKGILKNMELHVMIHELSSSSNSQIMNSMDPDYCIKTLFLKFLPWRGFWTNLIYMNIHSTLDSCIPVVTRIT